MTTRFAPVTPSHALPQSVAEALTAERAALHAVLRTARPGTHTTARARLGDVERQLAMHARARSAAPARNVTPAARAAVEQLATRVAAADQQLAALRAEAARAGLMVRPAPKYAKPTPHWRAG